MRIVEIWVEAMCRKSLAYFPRVRWRNIYFFSTYPLRLTSRPQTKGTVWANLSIRLAGEMVGVF